MTTRTTTVIALATLSIAGCSADMASLKPEPVTTAAARTEPPNSSAASWQMPWQLSPSNPFSTAKGDETILVWVPETGYVQGTPTVLASLGKPLQEAPGPNRTVAPCRDVVLGEADKVGAREVEAVSAGPQKHDRKGHIFAPVHMRITYAKLGSYEVRDATLTCIIDRKGKIVDAYT